jgi:hypothetical protein
MAMRILLQQKETGLYFKGPEVWTRNSAEAADLQLVLKFEDQQYDIVMPLVTERRVHSEPPRPTV